MIAARIKDIRAASYFDVLQFALFLANILFKSQLACSRHSKKTPASVCVSRPRRRASSLPSLRSIPAPPAGFPVARTLGQKGRCRPLLDSPQEAGSAGYYFLIFFLLTPQYIVVRYIQLS